MTAAECSQCGKSFVRRNTLHRVCSPRCAIRSVKAQHKAEKEAFKKRQEAAKPRSQWLRDAQSAFNAYIRARDSELGCISCGTRDGKVNAGHYLSTAARPELRFDELNVHRQCERCNTYLSGNLIAYRARLIERIGLAAVKALEGPHPQRKYSIDELKQLKIHYRSAKNAITQEKRND